MEGERRHGFEAQKVMRLKQPGSPVVLFFPSIEGTDWRRSEL